MAKNRRIKPSDTFTGMTFHDWHSNVNNLTWAQTDPHFKMIGSILLNCIQEISESVGGCSEGRAYGNTEGAFKLLAIYRSLGLKLPKPEPDIEADHASPPEHFLSEKEPLD